MNPSSAGSQLLAAPAATLMLLATVLFVCCNKPLKHKESPGAKASASIASDSLSQKFSHKKQKKKRVYLTFDDGPNKGTRNVLHIVQDEQVPASFFLVGEHVAGSTYQQQMWDSLQAAKNIVLCNHSYSHASNHYLVYYQNPAGVVQDFERTKDSLHLLNNISRTPGRNIWRTDSLHYTDIAASAAAADSLQQAGFIVIGWDVEWKFDPATMSVTTTADNLLAQIDSSFSHRKTREADNLVVLAHDQVYTKSDDSMQLRQLLQKLKGRSDYELSLITAYPGAGKLVGNIAAQ